MKFDLTNLVNESKSIDDILAEGSIFSNQKLLKETMIRKKFLDAVVGLYLDYTKSLSDLQEGKIYCKQNLMKIYVKWQS